MTRLLQRMFLESAGYRVVTAEDGEHAWELLNSQGADVLVTDHDMPKLSGLELALRVRNAGFSLPIVLAFGSFDPFDHRELGRHHITGVLPKPYSQKQLITAVESALSVWCKSGVS